MRSKSILCDLCTFSLKVEIGFTYEFQPLSLFCSFTLFLLKAPERAASIPKPWLKVLFMVLIFLPFTLLGELLSCCFHSRWGHLR